MEFNDRICVLSAYRWTLYRWFYLSLEEEFTIDGVCRGFTHGLTSRGCVRVRLFYVIKMRKKPQEKYAAKHLRRLLSVTCVHPIQEIHRPSCFNG